MLFILGGQIEFFNIQRIIYKDREGRMYNYYVEIGVVPRNLKQVCLIGDIL